MTETTLRVFQVWLNVINALLLRDIRARAGTFYSGYLLVFLMPFLHLAAVLIVFIATGRVPPVGTQPIIFYGLSILPFVVFVYPSRQIVVALAANRPLLYFPRVRIIDVIIARGLLETVNGTAVSAVVCLVLLLATGEFTPRDPFGIVCAILLSLYLGFSWGVLNALIAHLFNFWYYVYGLIFPLLWVSSGNFYYIHGLPAPYGYYLSYNPLLQCVEYIRYSYYDDYPSNLIDVYYVFWIATCIIAFALLFERSMRRVLLSA
jgi:capsular polysaccharide transport system permease protein